MTTGLCDEQSVQTRLSGNLSSVYCTGFGCDFYCFTFEYKDRKHLSDSEDNFIIWTGDILASRPAYSAHSKRTGNTYSVFSLDSSVYFRQQFSAETSS